MNLNILMASILPVLLQWLENTGIKRLALMGHVGRKAK